MPTSTPWSASEGALAAYTVVVPATGGTPCRPSVSGPGQSMLVVVTGVSAVGCSAAFSTAGVRLTVPGSSVAAYVMPTPAATTTTARPIPHSAEVM